MRVEASFFICKVSTDFCDVSSFSRCEFRLTRHKEAGNADADAPSIVIRFEDLFKVDPKPEDVDDAVKFIHRCKQKEWPCDHLLNCVHKMPDFKESEKSILIDVCSDILVPLCNEVILERKYREDLAKMPQHPSTLTYGNIGLGTCNTWHGTPDIRVRAGEVNFLYGGKGEGDAGNESGSDAESDGMTTPIEGKIFCREAWLPQVVAMTVVASFTEHNLHPNSSAMVPSILISKHHFRVCLYHCEKDILLLSSEVSFSTKEHLSQSAMALLWAVLNHRRFLAELPPSAYEYTAGIKSKLERIDKLQHFASLLNKTVSWDVAKKPSVIGGEDSPVLYLPPQKKKMRTS